MNDYNFDFDKVISKFEYKNNNTEIIKDFTIQINNICNYNCFYCFQKKERKTEEPVFSNVEKNFKLKIKEINSLNKKITFTIMGGEPSLTKITYFNIINSIYTKIKRLENIRILTNLSFFGFINKDDYIKSHLKFKDKLIFNASFHPSEIKNINDFKENILLLRNEGFKIKSNVLMPNKKYNEIICDILTFYIQNNIEYEFTILYDFLKDKEDYFQKNEKHKQWLHEVNKKYGQKNKNILYLKDNKIVFEGNNIDDYFINLNENKYKGMKCYANRFIFENPEFKHVCNQNLKSLNNDYYVCDAEKCLCWDSKLFLKERN